jgi:hypothetical protein
MGRGLNGLAPFAYGERMGLTLVTSPPFYPVTLEEAKLHLRVDDDGEDTAILASIIAATEYVENATGRQLITASYDLTAGAIGSPGTSSNYLYWAGRFWPVGFSLGITGACNGARINLPKAPLQSVTSIQYYDGNNDLQTLSTSRYRVHANTTPAYVVITDIPAMYERDDALTIRFVAGHGNQEDVPETLKVAMKMLIGEFYRQREASVSGIIAELPIGVERLIGQLRVTEYQ